VTYLVGLTALCSGYLFFLWCAFASSHAARGHCDLHRHRRDVSYQSLFHLQTSRKRAALYQVKGFNADRFQGPSSAWPREHRLKRRADLVDQGKDLRRAIQVRSLAADCAGAGQRRTRTDDCARLRPKVYGAFRALGIIVTAGTGSLSEEDGDHDQAEHEIKKAESKEAPPKKPKDDRHSKEDDAKL
jgi:hypothetical protein